MSIFNNFRMLKDLIAGSFVATLNVGCLKEKDLPDCFSSSRSELSAADIVSASFWQLVGIIQLITS